MRDKNSESLGCWSIQVFLASPFSHFNEPGVSEVCPYTLFYLVVGTLTQHPPSFQMKNPFRPL